MQIDPKVDNWVKLILTLLNLVANGSISLAGIVTPQQAIAIGGGCQVAITVIGAIMTAYSSSKPGPLAPPDPPVVAAAARLASMPANSNPVDIQGAKADATRAVERHTVGDNP